MPWAKVTRSLITALLTSCLAVYSSNTAWAKGASEKLSRKVTTATKDWTKPTFMREGLPVGSSATDAPYVKAIKKFEDLNSCTSNTPFNSLTFHEAAELYQNRYEYVVCMFHFITHDHNYRDNLLSHFKQMNFKIDEKPVPLGKKVGSKSGQVGTALNAFWNSSERGMPFRRSTSDKIYSWLLNTQQKGHVYVIFHDEEIYSVGFHLYN